MLTDSEQTISLGIHKCPICPISALCEKFNPQNINPMPAVKFFARLDLDQICESTNWRSSISGWTLVPHGSQGYFKKAIQELGHNAARKPKARIPFAAGPGRLFHHEKNRIQPDDAQMLIQELEHCLILLQKKGKQNKLAMNVLSEKQGPQWKGYIIRALIKTV